MQLGALRQGDHEVRLGQCQREYPAVAGHTQTGRVRDACDNKRGGLVNIVEKCLGSVAKSGTAAISAVVPPGERAQDRGLLFAATPAGDFVCGTLQLA